MSKRIIQKISWKLLENFMIDVHKSENISERDMVLNLSGLLNPCESELEQKRLEMLLRNMYRFAIGEKCNGVTFIEDAKVKKLSLQIWISMFKQLSKHPEFKELVEEFKIELSDHFKNLFSRKHLNNFMDQCKMAA